jgi:RNA polymerase sigma factor (sigma-70 family)
MSLLAKFPVSPVRLAHLILANVPLMSRAAATRRTAAHGRRQRRPGEPAGVPLDVNDAATVDAEAPAAELLDWVALAAAFRAGDAQAAEIVATHLAPRVTRLVGRLTAWQPDAEDLVQDVLVTALADRKKFRGDARLDTWITRIAINRCRAHARKHWLRRNLFAAWAGRQPQNAAPPADAAALEAEQAQHVRDAVARLPQKSREAVVLCYLEHQTTAEAAAVLGVTPNTIEVRLSRARKQLEQMLRTR